MRAAANDGPRCGLPWDPPKVGGVHALTDLGSLAVECIAILSARLALLVCGGAGEATPS